MNTSYASGEPVGHGVHRSSIRSPRLVDPEDLCVSADARYESFSDPCGVGERDEAHETTNAQEPGRDDRWYHLAMRTPEKSGARHQHDRHGQPGCEAEGGAKDTGKDLRISHGAWRVGLAAKNIADKTFNAQSRRQSGRSSTGRYSAGRSLRCRGGTSAIATRARRSWQKA